MLPSQYVSEIVLPTVDEYLAATGDLRRAILACGVTYHVRDYVAEEGICSRTEVDRRIKALCTFSFDVVEGVCLGSKHVRNTQRGDFKFTPGDEKSIPVFAFDVAGSGWNEARWEIPVWRLSIRAIASLSTRAFAPCSAHSAGLSRGVLGRGP